MQEIKVFSYEGNEVRTVQREEETWWVLKDVCDTLGLSNPSMIAGRLDDDEKAKVDPKQYLGSFSNEPITIISESGLYNVILLSRKREAKKFKRWVTHEVLPSIRKHGAYMTPETLEAAILNPDTMIKLCTALKDEQEKNERLTAQVKQQKQTIGELKPKAIYYDSILANPGLVTITQIAKDYGMSGKKLNKLLHECGIQYKINGQWLLYAKYHDCGYTHSETVEFEHTDGRKDVTMITKWTQKGRLFLYELLKQNGYLPSIEQPRDRITREISYPLRGIHEIFVL